MSSLAADIREAREAVERLLKALDLRTFVFTVELKERAWLLSIECASEDGWQTISFPVDPGELAASLREPAVRERLQAAWRPRLRACAKRGA